MFRFSSLLFLLAVSIPLSSAVADPWKGRISESEGVTLVANPAQAMEPPVTLSPKQLWRIGGGPDAGEKSFGAINRVLISEDDNVYLLDNRRSVVKVFSMKGEYLRTLGREGEGPGEFSQPADMCLLPDSTLGVVQIAPNRIVKLFLDGRPAGDQVLPTPDDESSLIVLGERQMGEHLVFHCNEDAVQDGRLDILRYLALGSPDGVLTTRLLEAKLTLEFANLVLDETEWRTFDQRWAVGRNGSLYACPVFADYRIDVWNENGARTMSITREFQHVKRTPAERDRVLKIFEALTRQMPGVQIRISDFEPDILAIYPREDGTLWVLTSRGSRDLPDGVLGVFDVLDGEGRFVREATVRAKGDPLSDGIFFQKDKMFVVTGFLEAAMAAPGEENGDAEPMSVICYRFADR